MKVPRRQFLQLAASAAALLTVPRIARAQTYPSRPVKIFVGQAAGSASDIVARVVAQFLSEKFGQQFLVEVRPGAAGNIATEAVTHMPPDGYTLLLVNSQNAINVALYEKLSFDFVRDIAPVGRVESVAATKLLCSRPTSGESIARFVLARQRMRFTIGTGGCRIKP
jgi:tripartite-type tricarboxylate transporter receptor subunit TctC